MSAARSGLATLGIVGVLAVVFARLVASPGSVIVDPDRPSVDRAVPVDAVSVGNDLTRLFLPHHARIAATLARTGHRPNWDPSGFGGRPLVGNPQAGLWYPPTWIAWRFWNPAVLGWLTILHLLWGGCGVFAILRGQGVRAFAAWVGGVCWAVFPYVLTQTYEGHYPHVWSASWMPWTFLFVGKLGRCEWCGWLLPVSIAMAFLTGHPQEAYYLALALLGGMVYELGSQKDRRSAARGAAIGGAVGLLAVGLLAAEWLPDLKAQPFASLGARLPAREAGKYHVGNVNLLQLIGPRALGGPADYFGPGNLWETMLGIGGAPLVLALIAVARSPRRRAVAGWSILIVGATLLAWGPRLGLFRLLYAIAPGMDRFRVPARALFLATTGAAVLVGLGVEAVAEHGLGRRWLAGYRCVLGCLIVAMFAAWISDPKAPPTTDRAMWIHAAARLAVDPVVWLSFGGMTLLLERVRGCAQQRIPIAILMGLLAVGELTIYGHDLIRIAPPDRFLPPDSLRQAIASAHRVEPFRVRCRDAVFGDGPAAAWGLEKTNINDSFQIRHAADLYETLYPMFGGEAPPRLAPLCRPEVQRAVLDRMNVALLISDRADPQIGWPRVPSEAKIALWVNPAPLPRAYVVPRAEIAPDDPFLAGRFPEVAPRSAVFLPVDPLKEIQGDRQPFTPADYNASDPDRVEIAVATAAPGLLVVADTWMPGWSAVVDGKPAKILRGNRAQRVVSLDTAGNHRVTMRYVPPGLEIGRTISLVSLGIWLILLLLLLQRLPRGSPPGRRAGENRGSPGPTPRRG